MVGLVLMMYWWTSYYTGILRKRTTQTQTLGVDVSSRPVRGVTRTRTPRAEANERPSVTGGAIETSNKRLVVEERVVETSKVVLKRAGSSFVYPGCESGLKCLPDAVFTKRDPGDPTSPSLFVDIAPVLEHIQSFVPVTRCAVAAGIRTGVDDPTFHVYTRLNFGGVTIEGDARHMPELNRSIPSDDVKKLNTYITPLNAKQLVRGVPRDCALVKMDIDGYDCDVLRTLFSGDDALRPLVVFAEVFEDYPPNVQFSVLYHGEFGWGANGHKPTAFVGCSLGYAESMLRDRGYLLLFYHRNNAIFVHESVANLFEGQVPSSSAELYKNNRPVFMNQRFRETNRQWQEETDKCQLRKRVLCYILDARAQADFDRPPTKVPFRFCVPGCTREGSTCTQNDADARALFEKTDWAQPSSCP